MFSRSDAIQDTADGQTDGWTDGLGILISRSATAMISLSGDNNNNN